MLQRVHKTTALYYFAIALLLSSCNAVKHLKDDELLLTKNQIITNGENSTDLDAYSLISQKPNPKIPILGIPLSLHIYNLAEKSPDSTFNEWLNRKPKRKKRLINFLSAKQIVALDSSKVGFNNWLKKIGTAPVIINEKRTQKSLEKIKEFYNNQGYFNVTGSYTIQKDSLKDKRGSVTYTIEQKEPYIIDSIREQIASPVVDSLFQLSKKNTFIKSGKQYDIFDFENEQSRLTLQMRNTGLYYFDQDYITFEADTNNVGHKVHIDYIIPDRRITRGDTTFSEPFKIHTVNEVRIITDATAQNRKKELTDSIEFQGYKLFSYEPIKYRPKALTDAVSITPGEIFKDIDRTVTYNQINNLRNFKYPSISYSEDPKDSTGTGLIANIELSPKKKYTLDLAFDTFTSTVQQFGIGFTGGLLIRNVFRGAENFEFSVNGNVGASKDNSDGSFFNTSDVGFTGRLSFPRILFPINTEKIIPKYTAPSTIISSGFSLQNNIGLDRQNFNGVFSYSWKPNNIRTNFLELANLQYVRNLRIDNYYEVYQTSYDRLNEIAQDVNFDFDDGENLGTPDEADEFIIRVADRDPTIDISQDLEQEVIGIGQRKQRLTENNLILASNFTWIRDSREGLYDPSFSRVRWKIEFAGNLLSQFASLVNLEQNEDNNYKLFGVVFSQYTKFETELIKHWSLGGNSILAARAFAGIALPYGNSNSIPFTQSYFAGGANDNRGWQPYDLGPGSNNRNLDFNEANFKLAFNAELRFPMFGGFKGAIFADAGNIWNVLDDIEDESFVFNGIQDLTEMGLATGFGLRYDFGFFVARGDLGFKTYNPALSEGNRWFKEYNFGNSVINIGINYPF